MEGTETLDERKSVVLRAVVSDHIGSGEPVGSGTVVRRHRLGVSAATIRNDMGVLTEMGYLVQPHTSAGRIPTDLGYRFYVDALPRWPSLPSRQERTIAPFLKQPPPELSDVVRRAAVLLSKLTQYGAVAQPPESAHMVIGGAANIVSEESFERRETVRRLLEALEEEEAVLGLLRGLAGEGEVVVRIGRENPMAAMREASLVVSAYRVGSVAVGAIAVIGPTRMHYPEAISAVRSVSRHLSRAVEALAG
ncbi:MAG: HrcA family transcriptional regulator [Actinomycetota bacterium]